MKRTLQTFANLKNGAFILFVLAAFIIAGCDNEPEEIDLEKNTELRDEVFSQILNNEEVFNAFVDQMRQNTTAMGWTMNNHEFTRQMFRKENMKKIQKHHPEMDNQMMEHMINRMEEDTAVANEMNRRMQERRLFHEDVMK